MSYHSSKYGVPVITTSKDERRSSVSSTDSRSSSTSRYSSSSAYSYSSAGASSRTSYSDQNSYCDSTSKQRSGRSEVVVVNTSRRSNPSRSSPTPDYGHVSERYTYPAHTSGSSRVSSGGSSSSRSSNTYCESRRY